MSTNPLTHRCDCGAEFRYPPELAGRSGACKKCGARVTLPAPAALEEPAGSAYTIAAPEIKPPRADGAPPPAPLSARIAREGRAAPEPQGDDRPGFWGDAMKGFMFWTRPGDLANVALIAAVLTLTDIVAPHVGCAGLLVLIGAYGMFAGYSFNVIVYSSSESDDLPNPFEVEGVVEGVLAPLAKMIVVSLAVAAPGIVVGLVVQDARVTAGVVLASYFLWPAAMLIAALGGVFTAFRLDYVVRTIVSSFVPYLGIWAMLLVGFMASGLAELSGFVSLDLALGELMPGWLAVLISMTVSICAWVIAMRTIGLYYRHFKEHFPWSAG